MVVPDAEGGGRREQRPDARVVAVAEVRPHLRLLVLPVGRQVITVVPRHHPDGRSLRPDRVEDGLWLVVIEEAGAERDTQRPRPLPRRRAERMLLRASKLGRERVGVRRIRREPLHLEHRREPLFRAGRHRRRPRPARPRDGERERHGGCGLHPDARRCLAHVADHGPGEERAGGVAVPSAEGGAEMIAVVRGWHGASVPEATGGEG